MSRTRARLRPQSELGHSGQYHTKEDMMAMRQLIVQQWVTVDNIAAEEDGGLSFVSGEPFSDTTNKAFKATVMGFIDSVDTMMLGANTYAQAKGYWPCADEQGEYGEKLNNLTKLVASSKLDDAPWGDFPAATVTRDPAATIRELKERSGKDIWLWGSLMLMHSMLDAGLVDEVRMLDCPASRGKGTRIFQDSQDLKLVEATPFGNGVAIRRYEVKKQVESPHVRFVGPSSTRRRASSSSHRPRSAADPDRAQTSLGPRDEPGGPAVHGWAAQLPDAGPASVPGPRADRPTRPSPHAPASRLANRPGGQAVRAAAGGRGRTAGGARDRGRCRGGPPAHPGRRHGGDQHRLHRAAQCQLPRSARFAHPA